MSRPWLSPRAASTSPQRRRWPRAIRNHILSNAIFSNGALGIDLGDDGPTPNDLGDRDTGPNELQNYPVLTSAISSGHSIVLSGSLNSLPNTVYKLQFFASTAAPGFGEGQTLLGTLSVTTDRNGNGTFSNVTFPVALPPKQVVSATATNPRGNTSEFSPEINVVSAMSPTLSMALRPDAVPFTHVEDSASQAGRGVADGQRPCTNDSQLSPARPGLPVTSLSVRHRLLSIQEQSQGGARRNRAGG
jgi:hypothetical protein